MKGSFKHQSYSFRKLLCFLGSLFFMFTVSITGGYAADNKKDSMIIVSIQGGTIYEVFKQIEKQTDYRFFYDSSDIADSQVVTINTESESVGKILDQVSSQANLAYKISNKQIHILKGNESRSVNATAQQTERGVEGTVTDEGGEPLIGVSVAVKGSTTGTMTDSDGKYSLKVPNSNTKLVVTYVGFTSQEISVGNQNTINIVLKEDSKILEEVVVVGYGIQKKVNLTGSVAAIGKEELASRPVTNVSSALGGLAAGVVVNQTSGHPSNDGAKIRVRGTGSLNNSDALVIVDGIEGSMDAVNPQDIESISILKDAASSAIYGSRAANGVVLITTKRGAAGKSNINFSSTLSMARPTKRHDFVSDYAQYMAYANEGTYNLGNSPAFPQSDIDKWNYAKEHPNELNEYGYPLSLVYPNTDWGNAAFENKVVQNYNLSANGGTDKLAYSLSLGYLNNPGVMINTGIERYQGRINLDSRLTPFLKVGTQTFFSTQKNDMGDVSNAINFLKQTTPGYSYDPHNGVMQSPSSASESQMANSVYDWLTRVGGSDRVNRINTTWYAQVDIVKGLSYETKINYQRYNREKKTYPTPWARWNFATGVVTSPIDSPETYETTDRFDKNYMITLDNVLRYNTTMGDHDFGILAGHNEYYYNNNFFSVANKGMIDTELSAPGLTNNVVKSEGTTYDYGMRSFFGRINYAYKSRYLLEANVRRDGSSRFASESRWGNFPSFSAAWRISEEDFVGDSFRALFQNMKVKASWGKLGNNVTQVGTGSGDGRYYAYINGYGKEGYSFGGNAYNAIALKSIGNKGLKWEETRVLNFGLEATTLDGRLSAEFDYYDKLTDGILFTPEMPGVMGTKDAPILNLAEVSNKGFEITLNWRDKIQDFSYSIGVNASYNKNRVEKYLGGYEGKWITDGTGATVWSSNIGQVGKAESNGYIVEGKQIGEYFVRKRHYGDGSYFDTNGNVNPKGGPKNGMIRTTEDYEWVKAMQAAGYSFSPNNGLADHSKPKTLGQLNYGDFIYADINEDGIYGDNNDREFTKTSSLPKWSAGVNMSARYKGFDFSMLWSGLFGARIYTRDIGINTNRLLQGSEIGSDVAKDHYFFDPNNPEDPRTNLNGKWPRLKHGSDAINEATSDFWIQSASFFRMKNIQLGYTIPKSITGKIYADLVRFYISGENLLTVSPFDGIDPETQKNTGYPTMKQIAFGVNINF